MTVLRDTLAARCTALLAILGYVESHVDARDLERAYVGRNQRSEGAFSWFANHWRDAQGAEHNTPWCLGSQETMGVCCASPWFVLVLENAQAIHIFPLGKDHDIDNVPADARYSVHKHGRTTCYDAAGVALFVTAPQLARRRK